MVSEYPLGAILFSDYTKLIAIKFQGIIKNSYLLPSKNIYLMVPTITTIEINQFSHHDPISLTRG
jgi:hypothetical protein